jgi:prepilin peptidase CpaA
MMSVATSWLFSLLLAVAAVSDVRRRRVPNWLVLALLVFSVAAMWVGASPATSWRGLTMGVATGLACWLPLWLLGLLGAGDVKLFAGASAWIGPSLSWRAALIAALLGGAMALFLLVRRGGMVAALNGVAVQALHQREFLGAAANATTPPEGDTLPYAVPMAMALLTAWFFPDFLRSIV